MIVGIGSQNNAKIQACKNAVVALQKQFNIKNEENLFVPLKTTTTVPDMPLTQANIKKGARERALFVYKQLIHKKQSIDYTIGLEGGVFRDGPLSDSYLQNWVYAFDGERGYFGSSASLPLPQIITQALYDERRELAEVIDKMSGLSDVRSGNGAFGILTRNMITRSASFEMAITCALSPFFNKEYYKKGVL